MNPEVKMKKRSKSMTILDKFIPAGKLAGWPFYHLSFIFLFITSVIYFYGFGHGVFFYQENSLLFVYSIEYLQKFIVPPGGLLVYAGNFLTQGYFNSFYGSLLVSALLILISIVFFKIYKRLSVDSNFSLLLILIPSCSLLLLHTRYDIYIQYSLGFLLTSFWLLVSISTVRKYFRLVILVLFPVFFYLAGSFGMIYLGMYVGYCFIYEKGANRYYFPAFLIGIASLTFMVFKEVLFLQPVDKLLGYPLSFYDSSRYGVLLSLLGGYVILFPLIITTTGQFNINKKFSGVIPLATILTVFPGIIFLLSRFHEPDFANLMKIEKSVYKQDWNAVIRQYERFPFKNVYAQYYYNLALSEKGQLCNRMFLGHQDFGPMALTLPTEIEQADKSVYFYYAVGLISEAHHLAYELMVIHGYRPENIKMLIKTELINGNYKIAERYIHILKNTFHYTKWARKYEKMVQNPALIATDPELGEKIRSIPARDFFIGTNDIQNIELLLQENPHNKRAFEYRIARMLLEKDFVDVVNEVKKMKEIGYTSIPRHIEEAVLAFMYFTRGVPDLGELLIRPQTEQRFIQYIDVYKAHNGDKSLLEKKMNKTEKSTFWFYLQFSIISSEFWKSFPGDDSIYGS